MSAAMSVLPLPSLPWHMAQSTPHHFLARARDSGEDLMGLACLAASAGIAAYEGGVTFCGVCCAESVVRKTSAMVRTSANLEVTLDIGASDERSHLRTSQ